MQTINYTPGASFYETVLRNLLALDSAQRVDIANQVNYWQWPDSVAGPAPDGWAELDSKAKFEHPAQRMLMQLTKETTSGYDRSLHHWVKRLGRTSEEHFAWWCTGRFNKYEFKHGSLNYPPTS